MKDKEKADDGRCVFCVLLLALTGQVEAADFVCRKHVLG